MKKIISLALSVILVLSSLSFGVVTAFANTKQTAPKIGLNETVEAYVDVNNKSYVEFTPATTGYYEFYCFTQSYGGNIMASIVDFDGETDNSVINDNYNPNLLCAAELMAGKTYYYVLESAQPAFSSVVSVRTHTHSFGAVETYPAHFDQNDSALSYDGYSESICAFCPANTITAYYVAPGKAKAKTKTFTYNKKKKTTKITVYDRAGNIISPSNYTVSYKNNTKPGFATVNIKFKGVYTGSMSCRLTIKPKKQSISSIKSKSKKKIALKWKKDSTVTGYQIQYSTSKKYTKKATKTITINKKSTTSKTISKLKSKKKYYVRIRAYKQSQGKKIYGAYTKTKTIKVK